MQKTVRKRAYQILETASGRDGASRIFALCLITLITLNVIAIVLESVNSLSANYRSFFEHFELLSVIVFSVEYVLRVWASVENQDRNYQHPVRGRLRHMFTPMALIDLIAILPFYLGIFMNLDLRFVRVLRVLRIFKLTRYFSAIGVLLSVLKEESHSFGAALFILFIILILASGGIYVFEYEAQPRAFGSIPAAMWWAVATLTTVGYGDVTPITSGGKIFGACITIVGIGMVALPAGILASGFSDHLRSRQDAYEDLVDEALEDGTVTREEQKELEADRQRMGLSKEDATRILAKVAKEIHEKHNVCPHCGKTMTSHSDEAKRRGKLHLGRGFVG